MCEICSYHYRIRMNSINRIFNKSFFFTFSIIHLLTFSAKSQEIKSYTLQQALKIACENNKQIKKNKLVAERSKEFITEAKEFRLPDMDFHTSYSRITNLTEFESLGLKKHSFTQTIPEMYDITSSIKLPIYEGNKINNLVKKAQQENELDEIYLKKTIHNIQMQVVIQFLKIYELQEVQKVIKERITEEKERLKEIKTLYKNGVLTKNEILRGELQLADRELALLTNEKELKIAKNDFKVLVQLDEKFDFHIDTSNINELITKKSDYTTLLEKTLRNEEIEFVEKEIELTKTQFKLAKANYYPKINLFGSYSFKYPNYMFFPPSPYLYSLGQIGIELRYNLSELYKNSTKMEIAKQSTSIQEANLKIVTDEMKSQIFNAYTQYEEVIDKILVVKKAVVLAEENYRIVRVKYSNQLVLMTEMIDADNALLQTKFNEIALQINAIYKYYQLLHIAGIIGE